MKEKYVLLVEKDSVMLETTSVTTTARMLSVLTNTTVTGADVTSLPAVLVKASGHTEWTKRAAVQGKK